MKRIYSIGGGKGGSGKSFITASLGVLLAKQEKQVVLVDLDLGASNLHTFLGLKNQHRGIEGFLDKKTTSLETIALPTKIPNLYLISSAGCTLEVANLFYVQKIKLLNAIGDLPFDCILMDLGAGTHFNTLDFFLSAPEGLIVTTPEPTALENTFRFIKSVYLRRLKQLLKQANMTHICEAELFELSRGTLKSPLDLISIFLTKYPEEEEIVEDLFGNLKFRLILNKFRGQASSDLGSQVANVCNRHLYPNFDFLGNVTYDSRAYEAILHRHIFIQKYPYTKTALDLQDITNSLKEECQQSTELQLLQ